MKTTFEVPEHPVPNLYENPLVGYCPCGRRIESTSTTWFWQATLDGAGNILEADCVHGVHFDWRQHGY